MPVLKSALRSAFRRIADTVFDSAYVQEKIWQTGKGLFPSPMPSSISAVSLLPVPAEYVSHSSQTVRASAARPVFITARFRSGSTFLWQLFRNIEGVTCYYEPLNEARWFLLDRATAPLDQTHLGVEDYRAEYEGMRDLDQWFDPDWAYRRLYMDETSHDPNLERYISELVRRANGRTVLQFNRVDFRLPWLRAHFPEAFILHLYRHPREQWMSIVGKGAAVGPEFRIRSALDRSPDGFYTLEWAKDLRCVFPFLEPAGRHPYELHYLLWRLSYLFGRTYGDMSVGFEDLVVHFEKNVSEICAAVGVEAVDLQELSRLNQGKPTSRWSSYADDAWYSNLEARCNREIETYFGRRAGR